VGRNTADDDYSPASSFALGFRKLCPALYRLLQGEGRYRYRELSVIYRGPGDYLGKVKALDTVDLRPVICFAGSPTYQDALTRLDHAVAHDRWKLDRFANEGWAR
jgi:hypothetical protein